MSSVRDAQSVLFDLINRTKRVVHDQDNFQCRKLRKLMNMDDRALASSPDAQSLGIDDVTVSYISTFGAGEKFIREKCLRKRV